MARKKTSKFKNITILSRPSPKTLLSKTVTNITGRGQGRVTVSHSVTQTEHALDIDDTLQDVGVMLLDENDDSTSVTPPPPPHAKVKRPPVSLYPFSLSIIFSYPLEVRTALLKTGCPTVRKPSTSSYVLMDWVTWMRLMCAYAAGSL